MAGFDLEPSEPGEDDERLIPPIPGVDYSVSEESDLGLLSDEVDEESEEDVLEEIAAELRGLLMNFGVTGAKEAAHDDIQKLWYAMDMSEFLVGDLVLLTTTHKQSKLRDGLAVTGIRDLLERAETFVIAHEVRKQLIEQAAPNLMKIGYGRVDAYRLPRLSDEKIARAFRTEGWLLGLPHLADAHAQIRSALVAAPDNKLRASAHFRIVRDELTRQQRMIDSDEVRARYDQRVGYEAVAYAGLKRSIDTAHSITEYTLSPFIPRK